MLFAWIFFSAYKYHPVTLSTCGYRYYVKKELSCLVHTCSIGLLTWGRCHAELRISFCDVFALPWGLLDFHGTVCTCLWNKREGDGGVFHNQTDSPNRNPPADPVWILFMFPAPWSFGIPHILHYYQIFATIHMDSLMLKATLSVTGPGGEMLIWARNDRFRRDANAICFSSGEGRAGKTKSASIFEQQIQ